MHNTIYSSLQKKPYPAAQRHPKTALKQPGLSQPAFRGKEDAFSLSRSASAKSAQIPNQLKKNIESAAATLYGKDQAQNVTYQILSIIQEARKNRPAELLKEDFERPADWYKDEQAYMIYAERFGTENGKPSTFQSLIPMLDYIKKLGASTVYLLPFLKSPGIDAGFDVSDYKTVRDDLGGNKEFEAFLAAARQHGIKVKADLVLNHVSDQHAWFQAALKGDSEKLNYFIHKDYEPIPKLSRTLQDGTWAEYKENDGTTTKRRIIFPDASSTHYRKALVNGKEKYFYHTFYPHQIDLNWGNPKVLYEAIDVMAHWANKGIDIFRLDALPCFVKPKNSSGENTPGTHAVLQILSASLQAMSPRSVLWAEICQKPTDIRPYFGEEYKYTAKIPGIGSTSFTRTNKAQLAYHFPEMSAIWAAMLTKKPDMFWQTMKDTPKLPDSAEWSSFLRVHDELSVELFPDEELQHKIYDTLSTKGEPFREGHAIGGRLASFLDQEPKRINLSNAILFSLPGLPLMYYGDEIGEPNNREFMNQVAKEREKQAALSGATMKSAKDARDIGRAPISKERLLHAMNHPETEEGQIFQNTQKLIALRKQEPALVKGKLCKIPASLEHVFSYLREHNNQRIMIANNLSDERSNVELTLPKQVKVSKLSSKGLLELQKDKSIPFHKNDKDNTIQLALQPYESFWIKLPENSPYSIGNLFKNFKIPFSH